MRNRAENFLANTAQRQPQEDRPVDEHHPKRLLPRDARAQTDRVGEERVDPHSWSQREGIVRHERHEGRGGCRTQCGHRHECAPIHARLSQDGRIDGQDVGHGGERRQARLQFATCRRATSVKLEVTRTGVGDHRLLREVREGLYVLAARTLARTSRSVTTIFRATSIPEITLPMIGCLPSSCGWAVRQMKN